MRLTRNDVISLGCDEKLFKTVVKTTFGQRRKTLRNSIRPMLPQGCSLPEDEIYNLRPEQLSVEQFVELTRRLEALRKNVLK